MVRLHILRASYVVVPCLLYRAKELPILTAEKNSNDQTTELSTLAPTARHSLVSRSTKPEPLDLLNIKRSLLSKFEPSSAVIPALPGSGSNELEINCLSRNAHAKCPRPSPNSVRRFSSGKPGLDYNTLLIQNERERTWWRDMFSKNMFQRKPKDVPIVKWKYYVTDGIEDPDRWITGPLYSKGEWDSYQRTRDSPQDHDTLL